MYSHGYGPQSSCDRRISCSHIQIEAPLHAEPHRPFVTPLNISGVRSQQEQFITFLLWSCGCWSLLCLHFTFLVLFFLSICNFLAIFIVWGFQSLYLGFSVFALPLGSFNINDSLILFNKATVMNWQIKMAEYWSAFMSFHRVAEGPECLSVLNSCLLAWVAMRQNCLSSALLCFLSCSSSYLTKMSVCMHICVCCVRVCVSVCVWDGGGEVQLMSSITFLVSIFGRHGDRGGDLHRQRDQKRTEHVLCQEQGECFFLFFVALNLRFFF